jgi:Holliday junction resolvasome RuvABC DNA-binding subunit
MHCAHFQLSRKHLFELRFPLRRGPVLALKILSGMSVDDLVPAVRAGDLVRLTRIWRRSQDGRAHGRRTAR